MNQIQDHLGLLLEGQSYEEAEQFCDFTLKQQNKASTEEEYRRDIKPIVKETVCYIVGAVLFNEKNEVLMMQESKPSCYGKWYLPCGKMEPGEDISEAAKREVKEETGLEFELTSLILVESSGGSWFRFMVTGNITGGHLKTPAEADKESIQAKWIKDLSDLPLRASDVIRLVKRGREYQTAHHGAIPVPWHQPILPALRPHKRLLLRTVILARKKQNDLLHVLVSEKPSVHLPLCQINPMGSLYLTLASFLKEIFEAWLFPNEESHPSSHGILSVEHTGHPTNSNDGCCLTLLMSIKVPLECVTLLTDKYSWIETEPSLNEQLTARLAKNMNLPMD